MLLLLCIATVSLTKNYWSCLVRKDWAWQTCCNQSCLKMSLFSCWVNYTSLKLCALLWLLLIFLIIIHKVPETRKRNFIRMKVKIFPWSLYFECNICQTWLQAFLPTYKYLHCRRWFEEKGVVKYKLNLLVLLCVSPLSLHSEYCSYQMETRRMLLLIADCKFDNLYFQQWCLLALGNRATEMLEAKISYLYSCMDFSGSPRHWLRVQIVGVLIMKFISTLWASYFHKTKINLD